MSPLLKEAAERLRQWHLDRATHHAGLRDQARNGHEIGRHTRGHEGHLAFADTVRQLIKLATERKPRVSKAADTQGFIAFWHAYPKKKGKGAAREKWFTKNCEPIAAIILQAVDRAKRSADWTKDGGAFIPDPATWLNREQWDDQPIIVTAKPLEGDPIGWGAFVQSKGMQPVSYANAPVFLRNEFRTK